MILVEKVQKYHPYHQEKKNKYEYITGKETLSTEQNKMIEQAKFTYSPLGKAFEKQTKIIEDQGKKNQSI